MHMADALLSPAVGGVMTAVSVGAIALSLYQLKKEDADEKKVPLMGVAGAFVFAAQMINFTIPGTGSSGHIGGGILLAALLGGGPALLCITAVLAIQALFFADGGLLALGCNIFNIGVIPCLLVYPLLFKPFVRKGLTKPRIVAASVVSVVVGLQLGAFGVVLETLVSGITALPFTAFTLAMQPIHLAIGLVEGLITAAVLCFVHSMEPDVLEAAQQNRSMHIGKRYAATLGVLLVTAALLGGGLSLYASANPDGLEWSMEKVAGTTELESSGAVHDTAAAVQESTALMPDYDTKAGEGTGTSMAGLVGGALTLVLAAGLGAGALVLQKRKRNS